MAVLSERPAASRSFGDAMDSPEAVSWKAQLAIGVALVVGYVLLSLTASPDAHWLTDVGGKSATVAAMVERGDWSTDLGYWAEAADPDGSMYPLMHTQRMPNGWWVNTTSVPMMFAAKPLWHLGGAQLALLIPMLGAAATALVAGSMERRLVGGSGLRSTLVVGAATPVTLYAVDFWEHSIAVALMLGAVNLVLAALDPSSVEAEPDRLRKIAMSGALFGCAAVMRQEALVYGFVAGVTVSLVTLRSNASLAVRRLPAMAGSAAGVLVLYELFERQYYGGSLRGVRSGGAASQVGSSWLARLEAAAVTAAAPIPEFSALSYLLSVGLIAALAAFAVAAFSGTSLRPAGIALAALGALVLMRFATLGPTFVPGMVASTPLVIAGVVAGVRNRRTIPLVLALAPLPLIFFTQYLGGILPQWGGRYLLLTGAILTVVACAELPRVNREAFASLVVASLCVTGLGAYWYSTRTTSLATAWETIDTLSGDDVVVWYDPVHARESGAQMVGSRWLSTFGRAEYGAIDGVLSEMDVDRFLWLSPEDELVRDFEGFEVVESHGRIDTILGLHAATYERPS